MRKTLLVSGVRHKMASIEVREKFALIEVEIAKAIPALLQLPGIDECAILTTCNRSEIYVATSDTELALESIRQFYLTFKGVDSHQFRRHLFTLLHEDAASHLFRVACGLDSLILGEGQILGQVKDTLSTAQRHASAGVYLDKLFKSALTVGKRVRTETGIADKDVSVSRAAFEKAKQLVPDLLKRRITLVGGGKMASLIMATLKADMAPEHQNRVVIINRSEQRLATLVEKYGFVGQGWEALPQAIEQAEVMFVATGAPHLVLGPKHFANSCPKLVIDISVPRNVDPRVGEIEGIQLFNTDDLAGFSGFSAEAQEALKLQAQDILEDELAAFEHWQRTLPAIPTITQLRAKIEAIRIAEAAENNPQSGDASHPLAHQLDQFSKSLINKILHAPTVRLKNTTNPDHLHAQASLLSQLFDLEGH
ncbi:MAG: glutamyl-tRNA reductase [Vampirovibrionales bacterium]|nr:glutamyl-tRNA reductase [Vampirovibrionales bacterium]